jgi:CPW-WPC domain-containing protein
VSKQCVAHYSSHCPDRWTSKAGLCSAPADYNGKCGFFLASGQYTSEEKKAYSEACDAVEVQFNNFDKSNTTVL